MKKTLVIVLCLIFTAGFVTGCGSYSSPSSTAAPVPAQQQTASPVPASQQAASPVPAQQAASPVPAQQAASPAAASGGIVVEVSIKNFAFSPATITIKKGDSVRWTNQDSAPHTASGPGFDSGTLSNGKSYTLVFNEAGKFDYQCNIHPSMRAAVIVQ